MDNYYLHDGTKQQGPFSLEELINKVITKDTPIWKEGLAEWTKAGELTELVDYFNKIPPPIKIAPPPLTSVEIPQTTSRNRLSPGTILLIITIICVSAFLVWKFYLQPTEDSGARSRNNGEIQNQEERRRERTPEELKEELADREKENPRLYLKAEGTYRENLIGELVLEGKIKNTATAAIFKDIVIEGEFIAASGTVLAKEKFTRYEKLGPGYEVTFKFKTVAPMETKSVSVRVVDATATE